MKVLLAAAPTVVFAKGSVKDWAQKPVAVHPNLDEVVLGPSSERAHKKERGLSGTAKPPTEEIAFGSAACVIKDAWYQWECNSGAMPPSAVAGNASTLGSWTVTMEAGGTFNWKSVQSMWNAIRNPLQVPPNITDQCFFTYPFLSEWRQKHLGGATITVNATNLIPEYSYTSAALISPSHFSPLCTLKAKEVYDYCYPFRSNATVATIVAAIDLDMGCMPQFGTPLSTDAQALRAQPTTNWNLPPKTDEAGCREAHGPYHGCDEVIEYALPPLGNGTTLYEKAVASYQTTNSWSADRCRTSLARWFTPTRTWGDWMGGEFTEPECGEITTFYSYNVAENKTDDPSQNKYTLPRDLLDQNSYFLDRIVTKAASKYAGQDDVERCNAGWTMFLQHCGLNSEHDGFEKQYCAANHLCYLMAKGLDPGMWGVDYQEVNNPGDLSQGAGSSSPFAAALSAVAASGGSLQDAFVATVPPTTGSVLYTMPHFERSTHFLKDCERVCENDHSGAPFATAHNPQACQIVDSVMMVQDCRMKSVKGSAYPITVAAERHCAHVYPQFTQSGMYGGATVQGVGAVCHTHCVAFYSEAYHLQTQGEGDVCAPSFHKIARDFYDACKDAGGTVFLKKSTAREELMLLKDQMAECDITEEEVEENKDRVLTVLAIVAVCIVFIVMVCMIAYLAMNHSAAAHGHAENTYHSTKNLHDKQDQLHEKHDQLHSKVDKKVAASSGVPAPLTPTQVELQPINEAETVDA